MKDTKNKMKELDPNYEINVDLMLDIDESFQTDNFLIIESVFMNLKGKEIKKKILVFENKETFETKQIFSMKDGKFVLEVDNGGEDIEYFYSINIQDLTL